MENIRITDVIPQLSSGETDQNSEPSLAVDPQDPGNIIVGSFSDTFLTTGNVSVVSPYFLSVDGGATWVSYGSLDTLDKTLAWSQDGSTILSSILTADQSIATFSGTTADATFASTPLGAFGTGRLDQPWIRIGSSNHVYISYNDLNPIDGKTASVAVSPDGGATYTPVVIDRVGGTGGQDAPSVRVAVSGDTVYAAFTRWNDVIDTDSDGETRYASQIVVVRSDNAGADSFNALGSEGAVVANTTGFFANTSNAALTLGQERTASDMAIAVDPNNSNRVIIAYSDASGPSGSGQLQLIVAESLDGGSTWNTKFTTSSATRSAQPALAISSDGTVGFLYDNYDPATDRLSQHFLTTSDDFATTNRTVLASETNSTPGAAFNPYLGDFFDLQTVGTTFYGVFSASNADNGSNARFSNLSLGRDFTGTVGTASFQLTDATNQPVASSIDPFFFTATQVACFLRGTRIRTPQGEVAVEDLKIDDRVVTLSGDAPIIWIGHRTVDCSRHPQPKQVWPIRISAGAFGRGKPARDLYLSPDHAVFVEDVLIPVKHLVNSSSIAQVSRNSVTYYHLELPQHDVVFADGLQAESYLAGADRSVFANNAGPVSLHPDLSSRVWEAEACAPLVVTGRAFEAAKRKLKLRAWAASVRSKAKTG